MSLLQKFLFYQHAFLSPNLILFAFAKLLSSNIPSDNKNLEIAGYNLVREDHPSNSKPGGVCVYYKSFLPFKVINAKCLQESISFQLRIGCKCCKFSYLYRSPS